MCLARLITSRIKRVAYVADDPNGGMVHKLNDLPAIWLDLAKTQTFDKARCSEELAKASYQIYSINTQKLDESLGKR
jgi:tRNA(Arg) A34 adenosine deaminase TadA